MNKHGVTWSDVSAAIQANPNRMKRLRGTGAIASVATIPSDEAIIPWISGWTEDTTFTIQDAVSFVLWVKDPMYRTASPAIRRAMEMEEAANLIHTSERVWKEKGGRQRGWVRKHLEEDLRTRAGGGDPAPNYWDSVRTVKRAALLVDYICMSKGIRIALWWPDQKNVTVIPATRMETMDTVFQLNCGSRRVLLGPTTIGLSIKSAEWPELLKKHAPTMEWVPPMCIPSMNTVTVQQIQEQLAALTVVPQQKMGRAQLWATLQWELFIAALCSKGENVTPGKSLYNVEYDGSTTE